MSWQDDKDWSDRYLDFAQGVLRQHIGAIAFVRVSSEEEDCKKASDFVVECEAGDVAVRFRRPYRDFRDWTVRSRRRSGAATELAKLRAGFARWYLYCWIDAGGVVIDYVIIDLDRVRLLGLLDQPMREYSNRDDATWFVALRVSELRAAGCLTVDECKSPSPLPSGAPRAVVPPADFAPPPAPKKEPSFRQGHLF